MYNTINLAITTRILPDGSEDVSIALRVIPTNIENGIVITQDNNATTYYRGGTREITDSLELSKVSSLISAIKALTE